MFLTILLIGLTSPNVVKAQYSLHVGESEYIETPDPPLGWIESATWDRGSYIAISESSAYGAIIYPTHYFIGRETITCHYTYGYYSGNFKRLGHSQKTYYITCTPVYGTLSEETLEMSVGQKKKLTYTPNSTSYTSYTNKHITWKSSNENAASVDSKGNVYAESAGSALITFDPIGGPEVYCRVSVKYIEPTSISINNSNISVVAGKTKNLKYILTPDGASATVRWQSSNENIVKVSSTGVITGISEGTATITATTEKGLSAICTVSVIAAPNAVELPPNKEVMLGYSTKLEPKLTPVNSETTYKWKFDNTYIASVSSNGTVTGKGVGSTNITVTTDNGLTATTLITVKNAPEAAVDHRNIKLRIQAIEELVNTTLEHINKKQ